MMLQSMMLNKRGLAALIIAALSFLIGPEAVESLGGTEALQEWVVKGGLIVSTVLAIFNKTKKHE